MSRMDIPKTLQSIGAILGGVDGVQTVRTAAKATVFRGAVRMKHALTVLRDATVGPPEEEVCRTCGSFDSTGADETFSRYPAFREAMRWCEPEAMLSNADKAELEAEGVRTPVSRWSDAGVCAELNCITFKNGHCDRWWSYAKNT